MKTIEKLYEVIRVKYLKLPKRVRNIFEFILFPINAYGFVVFLHNNKILYLLFISFWIIIGLIIYFFISKRFNKLFLIPIILLFILFILEFTPYNSQSMRKTFMEMIYSDMKNSHIYILCILLMSILLPILWAISFFVNKPFFLYNSINKRKKNIIIGVFYIVIALFFISVANNTIVIINIPTTTHFLSADSVPPYNKIIFSHYRSISVLRDNKLKKFRDNNSISISPPIWYRGLSPDANYITYSEEYSLSGIENIWLMKADGKDKKQLTYNEKISILTCSKYPLFNSKGNKIAFLRYKLIWKDKLSKSKEPLGLYVINIDGTGEKQIVSPVILARDWSWAPNGREIYFIKDGNLYVVNIENGVQRQLTRDGREYSFPVPSPDGNKLLIFLSDVCKVIMEPYIFDINKLKIIKAFPYFRIITGIENSPFIRWSNKGDKILFSYFTGKECKNSKIAILNILDGDIINLTDGKSKDRNAVWYNKEEQVVFIRDRKEIWIINKDGSNAEKMFPK